MKLNELRVGEKAKILYVDEESNLYHRFIDIGIIYGTEVECTLESPFKDPKAYFIRGAKIAIRNIDAEKILIEKVCEKL